MAKLTFTYDAQKGYVSNAFSGGVSLQNEFTGKGKHVIFIESRLDESMPWATLRTVVVKAQDVFIIADSSDGQVFRIICESEPVSVDTTPLNDGSSEGSSLDPTETITPGTNNDGEVNTVQEVIGAFKDFPENKTIQERLEEIEGGGLQEEDIEDIFYPKSVTNITASEEEGAVVVTIEGKNIDSDDSVDWTLAIDGTEKTLEGTGLTLTLSEEDSEAYNAAGSVTAKVTVGSMESIAYTLK